MRLNVCWLLVPAVCLALSFRASAQGEAVEPFPSPDVSAAVTRLLEQPYLSDEEKRALRIRHGVWEEGDLSDAPSKAAAALVRGAYTDPALDEEGAAVEDRAEAQLRRGDPGRTLDLLAGRENLRAIRLRGEALMDLGRAAEAALELAPLAEATAAATDADEIAHGVRGLTLLARLRGAGGEGTVGYQPMLGLLAKARDDIDRLSWRVTLAEALLLYEKDRYTDAGKALETTLTLNPRCAEAWALLGRMAAGGYDFPRAEAVGARLDAVAGPGELDAALVRAASLVRQSEGERAEAEIAPMVVKYPRSRAVMAMHAAAAAARFDFAAADARLAAFDELAPGSPVAYLLTGRAMAAARQYAEAARYLTESSKRAPLWAEPFTELGLSELQAGNNQAAKAALERAVELDKYNARSDNSLALVRDLESFESVESEHFIVRHKAGDDRVLAAEMLEPLERLFARVTGAGPGGIDHKPAHKTMVEVYPDHRTFGVRISGLPELHTIAAATGPVIAMEAPRAGPGHMAGPYDWARVVQHEYTHTVTLSRTRNRLPHWFTEASAVYLEDSPRDYNTVQLLARAVETDTLFDLTSINAAFVRPRRPTDRAQAYAQGHWMYEYMIERFGPKAPLDLMDRYATGEREAGAFVAVLGVTREEFLADFTPWARQRLVGWGVVETDEAPTLATLLAKETDAPDEPTPELIAAWLEAAPANPFVLEAAVKRAARAGKLEEPDVALSERYAAARPVDPLPHKLLASYYLAREGEADKAVPHLEWLDAREQHSTAYAIELARRYAATEDMAKASGKAARAVQIAPYDAAVREFAATIAIRARDLAAAERHIRALITLEPGRPVHTQRLEALVKMRETNK